MRLFVQANQELEEVGLMKDRFAVELEKENQNENGNHTIEKTESLE